MIIEDIKFDNTTYMYSDHKVGYRYFESLESEYTFDDWMHNFDKIKNQYSSKSVSFLHDFLLSNENHVDHMIKLVENKKYFSFDFINMPSRYFDLGTQKTENTLGLVICCMLYRVYVLSDLRLLNICFKLRDALETTECETVIVDSVDRGINCCLKIYQN